MPYSIITMRGALQEIEAVRSLGPGGQGAAFTWEAKPGEVNPGLEKIFPWGRPRSHGYGVAQPQNPTLPKAQHQPAVRQTSITDKLNDLLEYCWLVYSKTLDSAGTIFIGRQSDLWVPQQLSKVGISDPQVNTLWDRGTTGNIQVMDKWAPVVNDCWVLGGVHRRADFELVSPRHLMNLWNFRYHVVTAREILGLLHFGYALKTEPTREVLVCTDSAKARAATIQAYGALMKGHEATGSESVRALMSQAALDKENVNKEIAGFDRSRLHRVVPPR